MSTWPASGASPASRSRSATAAARFPPALSPHTATDCGDTSKRSVFADAHRVDASRSRRGPPGTGAPEPGGTRPRRRRHRRRARARRDVVHQPDAAHDVPATVEVRDETGRGALAAVDPDGHPVDVVVGDGRDLAVGGKPTGPRASSSSSGSSPPSTAARSGFAAAHSTTHGSSTPSSGTGSGCDVTCYPLARGDDEDDEAERTHPGRPLRHDHLLPPAARLAGRPVAVRSPRRHAWRRAYGVRGAAGARQAAASPTGECMTDDPLDRSHPRPVRGGPTNGPPCTTSSGRRSWSRCATGSRSPASCAARGRWRAGGGSVPERRRGVHAVRGAARLLPRRGRLLHRGGGTTRSSPSSAGWAIRADGGTTGASGKRVATRTT